MLVASSWHILTFKSQYTEVTRETGASHFAINFHQSNSRRSKPGFWLHLLTGNWSFVSVIIPNSKAMMYNHGPVPLGQFSLTSTSILSFQHTELQTDFSINLMSPFKRMIPVSWQGWSRQHCKTGYAVYNVITQVTSRIITYHRNL